jgi:hypothetical protein
MEKGWLRWVISDVVRWAKALRGSVSRKVVVQRQLGYIVERRT